MKKILDWFINLYAVWIVLAFAVGFFAPEAFMWFTRGSWMTWAMALVMLGMGLTLNVEDFKVLFKTPRVVVIAALAQYSILPLSGWLVATVLKLPTEFAVGLILVACCPAGTASNVITYIARANVALSVVSTAVSTLLGIFMTPILCMLLIGQLVPVDGWGMFFSVVRVVLIPVLLGIFINYRFPKFVRSLGQTGPVISTWAIVFISGGIIAPAVVGGREMLLEYAGLLALAATLVHSLGFGLGYAFGRVFRFNHYMSKAISCETGMQNGGLAAVLAKSHFPLFMPLVGVPAVFCSVIQTVIGGILATIWRFTSKPVETEINS